MVSLNCCCQYNKAGEISIDRFSVVVGRVVCGYIDQCFFSISLPDVSPVTLCKELYEKTGEWSIKAMIGEVL